MFVQLGICILYRCLVLRAYQFVLLRLVYSGLKMEIKRFYMKPLGQASLEKCYQDNDHLQLDLTENKLCCPKTFKNSFDVFLSSKRWVRLRNTAIIHSTSFLTIALFVTGCLGRYNQLYVSGSRNVFRLLLFWTV